jgi:hypothetical protein
MMGPNGIDLTPIIQWMNYKQDLELTMQQAQMKHES